MRRAVVADDTCAVDTEHHVQVLQCYVMDDIIVRPLQESGVDIAIRYHPCFREPRTERHSVTLGDADIEHAVRQLFLHDAHRAPAGHRRRDTDYLLVLLRQFQQRLAKHLLP